MTTPTTSLQTIAAAVLPVVANSAVTYNAAKNVFLSQGWTSAAGNMYYKAMRVSPRLIVCMDLGQGYVTIPLPPYFRSAEVFVPLHS